MKALATLPLIMSLSGMALIGCASKLVETPEPAEAIEISTFPSTLRIDDTTLEFTGYDWVAQYFKITICFDSPSQKLWLFDDVDLKIDDQVISDGQVIGGGGLGRADSFDCGYIYYPSESIPRSGSAELSIGRLLDFAMSKNHRTEDCNRAQRNLDATNSGIVISCDPAIIRQDYRYFIVTQKPNSLSYEDADSIAMEAFSDKIQINWKFSFRIYKP
jgi:hypothetical protein